MTTLQLDEPKYPLSTVARTTGWDIGYLRQCFARGDFFMRDGDRKAESAGGKSLLSLRGVMRLAVANALWSVGKIAPRDAFLAGIEFADKGRNSSQVIDRDACGLYPPEFDTYLVWRANHGAKIVPIRVEPDPSNNPGSLGVREALLQLLVEPFDDEGPTAVVPVNPLWDAVMSKLELPH